MKEIEDDAGIGKVGLHSGDVGWTHVHNHLGNRLGLGSVGRHGCKELGNGLGTAPFDHEQKLMALGVEHDGHIAMPFAGAGFVNHKTAQLAQSLAAWASMT